MSGKIEIFLMFSKDYYFKTKCYVFWVFLFQQSIKILQKSEVKKRSWTALGWSAYVPTPGVECWFYCQVQFAKCLFFSIQYSWWSKNGKAHLRMQIRKFCWCDIRECRSVEHFDINYQKKISNSDKFDEYFIFNFIMLGPCFSWLGTLWLPKQKPFHA